MPTLQDMARKGQQKLTSRIQQPAAGLTGARSRLAESWRAAHERAVANYAASGMGPTRVANYRQAYLTDAAENYRPDPAWASTWATNWLRAMQE